MDSLQLRGLNIILWGWRCAQRGGNSQSYTLRGQIVHLLCFEDSRIWEENTKGEASKFSTNNKPIPVLCAFDAG